jgi:branched-chain amino acid aminotransferase
VHRYLLHNDQIRQTTDLLLSPGQVGFMNGWGVFSTIRVANGVLFAFERHYRRMRHDASLMHVEFALSPEELSTRLYRLIEANNAHDATLRVCCVRNKGGLFEGPDISREADLIAFTADRNNWGTGARLMSLPHSRYGASPFAGTKVISWAQNLTWYETAHQQGFDEMLLLNEHGQVSECTSANIFSIHSDNVWTPPLATSGCLPGVTRAILLEEIKLDGIRIAERELSVTDLIMSRGVFITSSTRDLLPVSEIDGVKLQESPELLRRLQDSFSRYRDDYVARHRPSNEVLQV